MVNPKLLEAAKQYLRSHARFVTWDNYEDMENQDKWLHTYEFLREDKMSIKEFVYLHLSTDIQRVKNEVANEDGQPFGHSLCAQFLDEDMN